MSRGVTDRETVLPPAADLIARLQRFVGRTNTPELHTEIADEARRWLDGKPAGAS